MKKLLLSFATLMAGVLSAFAIDKNTVEIIYNGTTATVTVANNISNYVTVQSETSSHVRIIQSDSFTGVDKTVDNTDGEIIYVLSGSSADGEFYLEGSFKCTVELNGVELSNPNGPAINIQNGKRITVSAQKNTVNKISDGANAEYNGCLHCKGHLKMKGKGTLNVAGKSKHAIYSKEYLEVKNLTLNITAAAKDAIHCKEYFLMESGAVTISQANEDGIQVELSSDAVTGITNDHEDENTGNFYMTAGKLTISGYQGKAIKTDGIIQYNGGTQVFDKNDTEILTTIHAPEAGIKNETTVLYDLNGRQLPQSLLRKGFYLVRKNGTVKKVIVKQ